MQKESPSQKRKVYYYADLYENTRTGQKGIVFIWQDWSKMYWWGRGTESSPNESALNNVLEKLIQTHGQKEWSDIYQKYNQALLDIWTDPVRWKFPKCCLTLWRSDFEWWHEKKKFNKKELIDDITSNK